MSELRCHAASVVDLWEALKYNETDMRRFTGAVAAMGHHLAWYPQDEAVPELREAVRQVIAELIWLGLYSLAQRVAALS